MTARAGTGEVKLSCRHVWKVYGPDPAQFFGASGGAVEDRAATIGRIRGARHIAAACDVSFDVHLGEIFVIMGLSGSGKSTVVRCLSRLVEPSAGAVVLDGEDLLKVSSEKLIDIRRHKMGMVFQNFGLLPHQTVLENVAFPLKVQGIGRIEREKRALGMIELVGLAGREGSYPRELSGGQQQRVGIARSLAVEPALWFLDEPFSALDPLIRRQMQDEFLRLQTVLQKTIVFITHDFLEALRLADRIAIMKDGEIVQIGTPADVVMRPATAYVTEFTRDVPRVKVLTVRDAMEQGPGEQGPGTANGIEPVAADLSLERLLPRFGDRVAAIPVIGDGGAIVGRVTATGVLHALANAAEDGPERSA